MEVVTLSSLFVLLCIWPLCCQTVPVGFFASDYLLFALILSIFLLMLPLPGKISFCSLMALIDMSLLSHVIKTPCKACIVPSSLSYYAGYY